MECNIIYLDGNKDRIDNKYLILQEETKKKKERKKKTRKGRFTITLAAGSFLERKRD